MEIDSRKDNVTKSQEENSGAEIREQSSEKRGRYQMETVDGKESVAGDKEKFRDARGRRRGKNRREKERRTNARGVYGLLLPSRSSSLANRYTTSAPP